MLLILILEGVKQENYTALKRKWKKKKSATIYCNLTKSPIHMERFFPLIELLEFLTQVVWFHDPGYKKEVACVGNE